MLVVVLCLYYAQCYIGSIMTLFWLSCHIYIMFYVTQVVSSEDLKRDLKPIFEAFHKRSDYIKCGLQELNTESSENIAASKACKYA